MKYRTLIAVTFLVGFVPFSFSKGLIDANVLAEPVVKNDDIASPKVNKSDVVDLNLLDRTNQAMTLTSLNATQKIFDTSDTLDNTLRAHYAEANTIKIRSREFMGTLIVLPELDKIQMFKLGDTDNFSFDPSPTFGGQLPRIGTVSVRLAGADTSLHILGTSGNIYTFYVRGDTWDSPHSPTMKVLIEDSTLVTKLKVKRKRESIENIQLEKVADLQISDDMKKKKEANDYLESVDFDPAKIDFGYQIVGGDETIKPFVVYSDGYFTYFRFSEDKSVKGVGSFPVVYRVSDGSDVPVNTSPQGSTLRVEGINDKWTLRLGDKWLCIEKADVLATYNSSVFKNKLGNAE